MDPFNALTELPNLVADYKATAARLIEAEKELAFLKTEKFVGIEWVAELWSVTTDTARDMLKVMSSGRRHQPDIKVLSYGSKVVRYRKSDIERITTDNLVALKDLLAQKRATKNNPVR